AVWAMRRWPSPRLRAVGYVLSALGLLALAILIGRELLTWYPALTPVQQRYIGQRILFVLGTNTDLPVIQVLVIGTVLWFAARRQKRGVLFADRSGLRRIPLAVKVVYTAFVAVLVPYYLSFYGPANFLWICDIALLLTVVALWLESRFLASMQLIAVL